jgi:hypothetical protein
MLAALVFGAGDFPTNTQRRFRNEPAIRHMEKIMSKAKAAPRTPKTKAAPKAKAEVKVPSTPKAKAEVKVKVPRAPRADGGKTTDALVEAAKTYQHDKERKTAGGNVSVDSGDELAQELRGANLEAVYQRAARALGVTEAALRAKYAHLNPGMQRMNLGNRMRGAQNAK